MTTRGGGNEEGKRGRKREKEGKGGKKKECLAC
jgi:hypothetical protein